MAKLRFILIFFSVLIVGTVVGAFVVENNQMVDLNVLYKVQAVHLSVGQVAFYSFALGLCIGVALCLLYVMLKAWELRAARKEVDACRQELDSLRNLAVKDVVK